jgi:hypothetical protein
MQLLSKERNGAFTGSEGHRLFVAPNITEKQLALITVLENKVRTDKQEAELQSLYIKRDTPAQSKDRDSYIAEKAEELVTGLPANFFENYHTKHGNANEFEAHEAFVKVSGLKVSFGEQRYYAINKDCGTTPDAKVLDFTDEAIATVDYKCPTKTFFQQKMMLINKQYPEYQYTTKDKFYQAQWQMLATNTKEHYLVRYLAEYFEDKTGELVKIDLPVESRIFWHVIKRDEEVCKQILINVEQAAKERDILVKIFKQPILNPKYLGNT